MKIIATSDTHGNLPTFEEECDLAIFAGDIVPMDSYEHGGQLNWIQNYWLPYLDQVATKATDVVWTFGNHDHIGEEIIKAVHYEREVTFNRNPNVHLLIAESKMIQDKVVYAYPYVGHLPSWAFNRSDEELEELASRIPPCDILITHAPPFGFGDKCYDYFQGGLASVGDRYLAENLARIHPEVVFCGHIHEGFGHYRLPHVKHGIYSVSFVDERYDPTRELVTVDIP
jgi:Icc-related predicted phosphoesterase